MEIDLNDPKDFTVENLKKLISSEDDSVNTQFRVSDEGKLYLSRVVGNQQLEGVKFRFETNGMQNGYVGIEASENDDWVMRIYNAVKENWANPSLPYIDNF